MSTDTPKKQIDTKLDTLLATRDAYLTAKASDTDPETALDGYTAAKNDLEAFMDQQQFLSVLKKLKSVGWFRE